MHAENLSAAGDSRWLWRTELRGLLADLRYATAVMLIVDSFWEVQAVLYDLVLGHSHAPLQNALSCMVAILFHSLGGIPAGALAAHFAPAAGIRRYLWLGSATAFALLWWYLADWLMGLPISKFSLLDFAQAFAQIAAITYRSSARTATSVLMQRQIEGAALDAEVNRARLLMLRAQIEPHFLFNTLATVRTLGRADRSAAVGMIEHLMRYLSEALPKLRQNETTLAEEAQLLDAYLRIHQIRMGARLSYQLRVPHDLSQVRIPTMMLLTLVENALKHGISPSVQGGSIHVSAARKGSALVLQVSDSGRGMTATEGHGMGLANIRRRLTMLYGEHALLSLSPAESRGVVATLSIPIGGAS
ncbi:MAG: sensor histidine kinase [Terriglobales bacterium]